MAQGLDIQLRVALESGPVSLSTVRKLSRILAAGRFNIIHTHEYKSNALAQLLRLLHSRRIVATAHGYNETTRREKLYYGLERFLFRHVDAVIAPTQSMRTLLLRLGVPPRKLHVIPNGVAARSRERLARGVRAGRARLLYVGRLSTEKDPHNLLAAVAEMSRRGTDVELTLAGEGPEREKLQETAEALSLQQRVRFCGFVADVVPLLRSADVLVSPSRTECMPNAILEAMWSGVPIVATAVGGVGEMIRDGADGLLCPPGDPSALADAAERLLSNRSLATRLAGSAYRRAVSEFSFARRMERVVGLYRRLLRSNGRDMA